MDVELRARALLMPLPSKLKCFIVRQFANNEWRLLTGDEEERSKRIVDSKHLGEYVKRGLQGVTGLPTLTQSAKGILTAGVFTSLQYSLSKIKKGFIR